MTSTRRTTLAYLIATAGTLAAPRLLAAHAQPRLKALAKQISGEVVERGSQKFQELRRAMVWNPRVAAGRGPVAIVRVKSSRDVAAAVTFARDHGIKVAVRGSGHHYYGLVLRNDSLLLDPGAVFDSYPRL